MVIRGKPCQVRGLSGDRSGVFNLLQAAPLENRLPLADDSGLPVDVGIVSPKLGKPQDQWQVWLGQNVELNLPGDCRAGA